MQILSYVQARNEIVEEMDENLIGRALTISGRAKEWIPVVVETVRENVFLSDEAIIEKSGMGQKILNLVPRGEWVYLLNPTMVPEYSLVVKDHIVVDGKLFSSALGSWLKAQEIGVTFGLTDKDLTCEEAKVMRTLWQKQDMVIDREEIATSVWGENWSQKYSDWGIDALMHRLRKKLVDRWQVVTIKSRGYMLAGMTKPSQAPNVALARNDRVHEIPGSIYPSDEYLSYMNDPKRVRKVYKDLFGAMQSEKIDPSTLVGMTNKQSVVAGIKILCVNSYSYDNVDSMISYVKANKWEGAKVYFAHYDPRAVEMHQTRIRELGVESWVESIYDDLRESKLKSGSFDIVINDYRLNFNQDDKQNKAMMGNMYRVLKDGGIVLISTVVDGRYEGEKYGDDQKKAPINANKPGLFQADEHLVRRCWSVPYFKQLFEKTGFGNLIEFDIAEGKRWGGQAVASTTDPRKGPYYRRWMGRK